MTNLVEVSLAIMRRGGCFFLQRRDSAAAVLPGLWEFPGGKVEPGESPEAALRRELQEELGWTPSRIKALPAFEHAYKQHRVRLRPFYCEGPGQPRTELAWGWFSIEEMKGLPIPEANRDLIAALASLDR